MIQPEFHRVLPQEVGRYGFAGACILALIRFATAIDDERNGRFVSDGDVWWRVSYSDMAAALGGVSKGQVRRAVESLEAAGAIQSAAFADEDRTKAFRLSDQPSVENGTPATSQVSKTARGVPKTTQGCVENDTCTTYLKEPKEVRENAADAASLSESISEDQKIIDGEIVEAEIIDGEIVEDDDRREPPEFCRAHMPHGTGESCRACKTARLHHERWSRTRSARILADLFAASSGFSEPVPTRCDRCDGRWVLGPDGNPVEPAVKCRHGAA